MTEIRHFAGWLRSLAGLAAVAGATRPQRLRRRKRGAEQLLQERHDGVAAAAAAYSGVPTTLTITGGDGPIPGVFVQFRRSLPVAQNVAGRTVLLLANNVDRRHRRQRSPSRISGR